MLWYWRLDFASAQPSRIGAEYVDCTSRIGAEWGAEFAELPSIIRRGLNSSVGVGGKAAKDVHTPLTPVSLSLQRGREE